MENPKSSAKQEDKRRQICLENLRKGREKLMKLRAKGFSTRVPIKGKNKKTPEYKKRGFKLESESDSDSEESETETETESDSESEEEQIKKKKQPKKQAVKKQKGKGGKISKLKGEMEEMKGIINQLKNTKLNEPKKKGEKVVINMMNPHQPAPSKAATDYDALLKKAMFGNL